jgi:succinate dehydrogenase / fumarate reductase iron-sulfur subunit
MMQEQVLKSNKKVKLEVFRSKGGRKSTGNYQHFDVPYEPGMTVLSALLYAKEMLDHSIAIRYSCRMACCGSCGMTINGLPRLACYTQVTELPDSTIIIAPLENYPPVRDLVTDFEGFFEKHLSVKPFMIRENIAEQETSESEYGQVAEEVEDFLQFSQCIKCGCCNAACPTMANDAKFIGPQALAQAYRYVADSRDEGGAQRLSLVDEEHGVWRCHFAGSCSHVCPKGVDPALAIQRLRRLVISKASVKRPGSPLLPKRSTS